MLLYYSLINSSILVRWNYEHRRVLQWHIFNGHKSDSSMSYTVAGLAHYCRTCSSGDLWDRYITDLVNIATNILLTLLIQWWPVISFASLGEAQLGDKLLAASFITSAAGNLSVTFLIGMYSHSLPVARFLTVTPIQPLECCGPHERLEVSSRWTYPW